jgi:hypothetical protein
MTPRARDGNAQRGQSVTEFALFLPILVLLLLGIGELARVYSTMIAVESAAREAADWGAFRPGNWDVPSSTYTITVEEMERRACTPLKGLTEYNGDGSTPCPLVDGSLPANPTFACDLYEPASGTWASCSVPSTCNDADKMGNDAIPCKVRVTLSYTYDVIIPTELLGLPTSFTFTQFSIFNVADEPATGPTPTP